jgi:hypothetical protein
MFQPNLLEVIRIEQIPLKMYLFPRLTEYYPLASGFFQRAPYDSKFIEKFPNISTNHD